ncbi:MAG TPA: glycine oxidase ThiO [Myxococcota bacterium]|nr:glycine oxidase ThiO [Myxococcota bacterium]
MRAADVAVVGGGVIGAACAWSLARHGASVVLLERDAVGAHASGAAAGMLAPIAETWGAGPIFAAGLESLRALEGDVDELRALSGVDPELVRSGVLRVAGEPEAGALRGHARALEAAGCSWLDAGELRKLEPGIGRSFAGAVHSAREGHVDPARLTRAYAGAAARRGARIETGVEVMGLVRAGARVTGVRTAAGELPAHDTILCTGAWAARAGDWLGVAVPVTPVKGQMLALDAAGRRGGPILWSDDAYLVPRPDGELRVGATVEHAGFDARPTAAGAAGLLAGAFALVPELRAATLLRVWAGLRPGSPDELPLIGPAPGVAGAWLAAGHFRNGILLAALTGAALADEILDGRRPPGLAPFDPARHRRENPSLDEPTSGRSS